MPNVSIDEDWTRAVEAVEHIVGSDQPLVATPEETDVRPRRRHSLALSLGLSLFLASGVAIAMALAPAPQSGPSGGQTWQSAARQ